MSEPSCESEDVDCDDKEMDHPSNDSVCPSSVNFPLFGDGYVCLPGRNVSRSTQDLVCHSTASTNSHRDSNAEQDQNNADCTLWTEKTINQDLSKPTSSDQPSSYTSGPFTPWPQEGTIPASGYCQLPTALMRTED